MEESKLSEKKEKNLRKAYVEVLSFFNLLDESYTKKIPKDFIDFIRENKDEEYEKVIYRNIPIKEQNLMDETLNLIAFLNLKYWCENDEEKANLINIYSKNDSKK